MSIFKEGVVIGVGSLIRPDAPLLGHLLAPNGDQLLTFDCLVEAQTYWNEHRKSSQLAPYFQYHTSCLNCGIETFIRAEDVVGDGLGKLAICAQCGALFDVFIND